MGSIVLESKQAGSGKKCSLSPLQPGCAEENIRFERPGAGDPMTGHSHGSASGSMPCCHHPLVPVRMKEDLLCMHHKPPLNSAFGLWGSICCLLQDPIKLGCAKAREDPQKGKVIMYFLQGRLKSCKPSQAMSVLGAGFGMLIALWPACSHRVSRAVQPPCMGLRGTCIQLPQHHRCDGLNLHKGTWVFPLQKVLQQNWKS